MSRRCEVCGKKARSGFNVSHSHVKTKRKWLPNLQTMRVSINGTPKSMLVCAKCIKAGKVTRQPAKQQKQPAT